MSLVDAVPHLFLVIVFIVVAVFVIKKLLKVAIFLAAAGLLVYLAWILGWFSGG